MRRDEAFPSPLHLAQGELSSEDLAELVGLKALIQQESGFFCDGYKDKCLRRRVAVRMRARGVHRYADYAALLRSEPEEYERLLAALTINVSKFFRNAEVWAAVRERVLPDLLARPDRRLRVWCAGAAAGEEPYTLAILIEELARSLGEPTLASRFELTATDVDRAALTAARAAAYPDAALLETPAELRDRWFEPGPPWVLRESLRRRVSFEHADLIGMEMPQAQHLIICRNVFIYFERSVQERLFERFRDALVPGGYLVLGKVETLFGRAAGWFEPVASRERVYRRR